MIYVYAFVDPARLVGSDLRGLQSASISTYDIGDVAAVGSVHEDCFRVEPTATLVRQHGLVVEALTERFTVAPVRFGTTFADGIALRRDIGPLTRRLSLALRFLRGKCELALRISLAQEEVLPAETAMAQPATKGAGRRYLEHVRRQAELPPALQHVHSRLAASAVAATARPSGPASMTASYLVETASVPTLATQLEGLAETIPAASLSLTGPWAPYSFVATDV